MLSYTGAAPDAAPTPDAAPGAAPGAAIFDGKWNVAEK